jgi:hypothetical protein
MSQEPDAPVRGRAEIDIEAPPEAVWDVLTKFQDWPRWNPDVKSMAFEGPLAPGTEFRWKAGPGTIVSKLDRIESPRYISWHGRTLSIKAYHEWWLEPRDGGTHVKTEETFRGLLARLLRAPLQKTLDKSFQDGVEQLKRAVEQRLLTSS